MSSRSVSELDRCRVWSQCRRQSRWFTPLCVCERAYACALVCMHACVRVRACVRMCVCGECECCWSPLTAVARRVSELARTSGVSLPCAVVLWVFVRGEPVGPERHLGASLGTGPAESTACSAAVQPAAPGHRGQHRAA